MHALKYIISEAWEVAGCVGQSSFNAVALRNVASSCGKSACSGDGLDWWQWGHLSAFTMSHGASLHSHSQHSHFTVSRPVLLCDAWWLFCWRSCRRGYPDMGLSRFIILHLTSFSFNYTLFNLCLHTVLFFVQSAKYSFVSLITLQKKSIKFTVMWEIILTIYMLNDKMQCITVKVEENPPERAANCKGLFQREQIHTVNTP